MALPIRHDVIKAIRKTRVIGVSPLSRQCFIFSVWQTAVFDLGQIENRCAQTIVDAESALCVRRAIVIAFLMHVAALDLAIAAVVFGQGDKPGLSKCRMHSGLSSTSRLRGGAHGPDDANRQADRISR
jgi:hypothetical protein